MRKVKRCPTAMCHYDNSPTTKTCERCGADLSDVEVTLKEDMSDIEVPFKELYRVSYPHRYKDGKIDITITEAEFLEILDKAKQYTKERREDAKTLPIPSRLWFKDINIAGLVSMIYYTGLRISEIVGDPSHAYKVKDGTVKYSEQIKGLVKEDITVIDEFVRINATECRKHGKRTSPLWIKVNKTGVEEIIKAYHQTSEGQRLFPISKSHAWKLIKHIAVIQKGEKIHRLYPHFFRLNRATKFADDPETTVRDLQQWFGWRDGRTLSSYMARAGRETKKMAERM